MKRSILFALCSALLAGSTLTADAKPKYDKHYHHEDFRGRHDDHHHYGDRTRVIYVIEHGRPVKRVVYVSPRGSYYHIVSGRRVYIRERYFTSYPSKYFYPDGRRRLNISFSF